MKCKLDSPWMGPYLVVSFMGWTLGIQKDPESPIIMIHCQDAKKVPGPPGVVSWLTSKESTVMPSIPVLGASTMHRAGPSSLTVCSLPSAAVIAVSDAPPVSQCAKEITSSMGLAPPTVISAPSAVENMVITVDSSSVLHPFHVHKMDSGPVRLMTIAHAFNYRVAVLRDGVKSAIRVGRSRKAERCFLDNAQITWGQQVAIMFQIVSTLMEEVPDFELAMRTLDVGQPLVQLTDDNWGHDGKCARLCECLLSDRTEAFVHCLIPPLISAEPVLDTASGISDVVYTGFTFRDDCGYLGIGRAGSIPFVSARPGAYGHLLLAVFVRWKSGLLVSSDWFKPVIRG